jgi:hypothetical protein
VPYQNLTAALILDGVDVKVNDWGTTISDPEDYLPGLVRFGLFTTDHGDLEAVDLGALDTIIGPVRKAQAQHYRNITQMSRRERIDAGAYVYFTFLRPFAEVAGVTDQLDWTVPRDSVGPLYDIIEGIDWTTLPPEPEDAPWYPPLSEPASA